AQPAAQVLTGFHHALEDGLALAEGGGGIDTLATGQHQGGNRQQAYNLVRHGAKPWSEKSAGDYPLPARHGKSLTMSGFSRPIPSARRSFHSRGGPARCR